MKTIVKPNSSMNLLIKDIVKEAYKGISRLEDFYINLIDHLAKITGYNAGFLQDVFEDNDFDIADIEEFIQITLEKDW